MLVLVGVRCWGGGGQGESWAAASQMIDGARAAIAGAKVCQRCRRWRSRKVTASELRGK